TVAGDMYVYPGQAGGTFGSPQPYPAHGAIDVRLADVDNDGSLDAVVLCNRLSDPELGYGTGVEVFKGQGDLAFSVNPSVVAPATAIGYGYTLDDDVGFAADDFNEDGRLDVAVAEAGD